MEAGPTMKIIRYFNVGVNDHQVQLFEGQYLYCKWNVVQFGRKIAAVDIHLQMNGWKKL